MTHMKYVVVSRGNVAEGFDKNVVSQELAKILDQSPDKIKRVLIAGKVRKVKTVASPQHANLLYNKLSACGLICGAVKKPMYDTIRKKK